MLKSVEIWNFQSHKHTIVEFDEKFNAIIGDSGAGKTGIFDSIMWVWFNEPDGLAFMSWWVKRGDMTKVKLTLVDGHVIIRGRSKSENFYLLGKEGDQEDAFEKYEAFGRKVPEPIADILRVERINVQTQEDVLYFLDMSPGERARELNEAVDMSSLDRAFSHTNGEIKKNKSLTRHKTEDLAATNTELLEYADLDLMERKLRMCERREERVDDLSSTCRKLAAQIEAYSEMNARLVNLVYSGEFEIKQELIKRIKEHLKRRAEFDEMERSKIAPLKSAIKRVYAFREILSNNSLVAIREKMESAQMAAEALEQCQNTFDDLIKSSNNIKAKEEEIRTTHGQVLTAKMTLDEAMPETCPLCGRTGK